MTRHAVLSAVTALVALLVVSCAGTTVPPTATPIPSATHSSIAAISPSPNDSMPTAGSDLFAGDSLFAACIVHEVMLPELGRIEDRIYAWVLEDDYADEEYDWACQLILTWSSLLEDATGAFQGCVEPESERMLEVSDSLERWLSEEELACFSLGIHCTTGDEETLRQARTAARKAADYFSQAMATLLTYEMPTAVATPTASSGTEQDHEFLRCFQEDAAPAMDEAGETFEALKNMMGTGDLPDYCESTSQWQSEVQNAWEMLWRCPEPSDKKLADAKESCLDSLAEYAMASHYLLEFCETHGPDDLDLATWSFEEADRLGSECMETLESYEQ